MGTCNYSATATNMKLVHWPLMGGLLHLVQQGRDWVGPQPSQAHTRCTKCNSPPIAASVSITVMLCTLLCSFNVPITGLVKRWSHLYDSTVPRRFAKNDICPCKKSLHSWMVVVTTDSADKWSSTTLPGLTLTNDADTTCVADIIGS